MFDKNMPVMVICATKVIHEGQEILADYGAEFWNKISISLAMEHKNYQNKVEPTLRELEQLWQVQINKNSNRGRAAAASSSAAAPAPSLPLGPAFLDPSESDRWLSYSPLFNQHDTLYAHVRPVRFDPVTHADPFEKEMFDRAQKAAVQAEQRETERVERSAKMQAAAAVRAAKKEEKKKGCHGH